MFWKSGEIPWECFQPCLSPAAGLCRLEPVRVCWVWQHHAAVSPGGLRHQKHPAGQLHPEGVTLQHPYEYMVFCAVCKMLHLPELAQRRVSLWTRSRILTTVAFTCLGLCKCHPGAESNANKCQSICSVEGTGDGNSHLFCCRLSSLHSSCLETPASKRK